jgi:hypothetical protein
MLLDREVESASAAFKPKDEHEIPCNRFDRVARGMLVTQRAPGRVGRVRSGSDGYSIDGSELRTGGL